MILQLTVLMDDLPKRHCGTAQHRQKRNGAKLQFWETGSPKGLDFLSSRSELPGNCLQVVDRSAYTHNINAVPTYYEDQVGNSIFCAIV